MNLQHVFTQAISLTNGESVAVNSWFEVSPLIDTVTKEQFDREYVKALGDRQFIRYENQSIKEQVIAIEDGLGLMDFRAIAGGVAVTYITPDNVHALKNNQPISHGMLSEKITVKIVPVDGMPL